MENNVDKILDEKFLSAVKFSEIIENIVKNNSEMNYIDAIIYYCEENNVEVESISKLVSKPLKEKIKYNAVNLNFLKRTSKARLVI
jgi:hypothetical protein